MKKKNVMIITAAVLVCAITITGIARAVRGGGSAVDVTQVSYLNSGWWDEGTSTSGYVTANASQDVYLESDSVVEKVYVKKGDKVKIGDTLLEYDKTLLQLNLEEEQINKQIQELELQGAKNDLEKLKKITPVPDSEGSSSGASLLDEPDDSSDDLDDSGADGYEEARATIVKHNVSLVSTAAGADVQVIDGNSDGSDSTGTAGGETTQQTESQTPESTTLPRSRHIRQKRNPSQKQKKRRKILRLQRQRCTRNWIIRRNTIKEAERKKIRMCISAKKEQRFRHLS